MKMKGDATVVLGKHSKSWESMKYRGEHCERKVNSLHTAAPSLHSVRSEMVWKSEALSFLFDFSPKQTNKANKKNPLRKMSFIINFSDYYFVYTYDIPLGARVWRSEETCRVGALLLSLSEFQGSVSGCQAYTASASTS